METTYYTEEMPSPGLSRMVHILTAGELRKILAGCDDDLQILIGDVNGEYFNVAYAHAVSDDDGGPALTLFCEDTYDPRQF